jgi:hypothetical protein
VLDEPRDVQTSPVVTMRPIASCAVALSLIVRSAASDTSVYVSSKRTIASSNGGEDTNFTARFIGPDDPASSHSA